MARIAGIDLRLDKRIEIALTDIYGIGRVRALDILASAKVEPERRVKDMTEQEVSRIRQIIDRQGYVMRSFGQHGPLLKLPAHGPDAPEALRRILNLDFMIDR